MGDRALWLRRGDNDYVFAATRREPVLTSGGVLSWVTPDGGTRKGCRDLNAARNYMRDRQILEMLTEAGGPFRCQARMAVSLFTDRPAPVMKVVALVGRFEVNHYLDTGLAAVVPRTVHGGGNHTDLAYLLGIDATLPAGAAEDFAEVLPYLEPLPLLRAAVTAAVGGTDR